MLNVVKVPMRSGLAFSVLVAPLARPSADGLALLGIYACLLNAVLLLAVIVTYPVRALLEAAPA